MSTHQLTQLESDLLELTHEELKLRYAQSCRLLGQEAKKVITANSAIKIAVTELKAGAPKSALQILESLLRTINSNP